MLAQQHKIMRQVLEVRGCPPGAAQRIQSELRGAYYERLLPVIDRICSDLSTPGRVDRIDKLEIDLGELPLEALESSITGQFEAAFSRAMSAAIGGAPQIDSGLELFSYFIDTGTVPWWADRSDRGLLEANLEGLIRRAPQALRRTIHAVRDPERMLRRIVRAYPDRLLDDLAVMMAPSLSADWAGSGAQWVTMLESVSGALGDSVRAARNLWWEEVLRAASAGGAAVSEAPNFFRTNLTRVARRLGSDYRTLLADLRRALDESTVPVLPWVHEITAALWRELDGDSVETRAARGERGPVPAGESVAPDRSPAPGESDRAELLQGLAQLELVSAPHAGLWARLRAMIDQLPAEVCAQAAAAAFKAVAFDAARERASGGEVLRGATIDALAALVRAALGQRLVVPGMVERYARQIQQFAPPGMSAAVCSELGPKLLDLVQEADVPGAGLAGAVAEPAILGAGLLDAVQQPDELGTKSAGEAIGTHEKGTPVVSGFSDADELYVENAGLVILWPFLANFFERLGLTEEKRFKDEAAAQRAVGLLQYVAGADESPPETLLPLNKVLCGLAPEEVFDFGAEITATEIEECNDLLAAVIQQAPILREMSIAGFRASFLLRKGQLGARDGNWLLRVERATHDIVLERFPWGVNFVKLPWMEAMMQVEW